MLTPVTLEGMLGSCIELSLRFSAEEIVEIKTSCGAPHDDA